MAEFNHYYYKDFIDTFNIKNGQLADQEKLNESVDILKKEVDNLYNRAQIIRGQEGFQWKSYTPYVAGEIIWYGGQSYKANIDNYNEIPSSTSTIWVAVDRSDYTLSLDPTSYITFDNTTKYTPTLPYNPSTKRYVDETLSNLFNNNTFAKFDNNTPFTPINDYNISTKKYVDNSITSLSTSNIVVQYAENANKLGGIPANNYVKAVSTTGLPHKGLSITNTDDFIRTTTSGFLPKDQSKTSVIGASGWEFKEMHAVTFYGKSTSAQYADLAEKYTSDKDYEVGTVLAIGGSKETTLFKKDMRLAGVVSENPAFKMNNDIEGVYIALKGRIYVKIKGYAKKGDYIVAYDNGLGIVSDVKTDNFIGIALEDNVDMVEVKI